MLNVPFFRDKDGTVLEHATIPTNNAMISAECSPKCFYQVKHMGTITEDIEFTIKVSQLDDWVRDVKKIVTAELAEPQACLERQYGKQTKNLKRCLPPGYFWLRFGRGNQNLLSTNTGTEDVAYVQWMSLVSVSSPNKHTKQSSLTETIEQLSLCKYKARPHWGKNHERTFRHPKCHVRGNFPATNIAKLLNLQQRHDPLKHFEPELFSHLRRRSGPEYSNQCSLHFWCYCELDAHCARGHTCQPSPVFPEYKTCRMVEPSAPQHDEL
jgi:L-gulonolactone oxidase